MKDTKLPEYPVDRIVDPGEWLSEVVINNCQHFLLFPSFLGINNASISLYHFIETLYHYDIWIKIKENGFSSARQLSESEMPSDKNFQAYEEKFLKEDSEFGRSFSIIKEVANGFKHKFLRVRPGYTGVTATGFVGGGEDIFSAKKFCDKSTGLDLKDVIICVLNRWVLECKSRNLEIKDGMISAFYESPSRHGSPSNPEEQLNYKMIVYKLPRQC